MNMISMQNQVQLLNMKSIEINLNNRLLKRPNHFRSNSINHKNKTDLENFL